MIELTVNNCYVFEFYYKMYDEVMKVDKNLKQYIVPVAPFVKGMTDIWIAKRHKNLAHTVSFSFCALADYTFPGICNVHICYEKERYRGYIKIEKA